LPSCSANRRATSAASRWRRACRTTTGTPQRLARHRRGATVDG
jgi:hypothetical protein